MKQPRNIDELPRPRIIHLSNFNTKTIRPKNMVLKKDLKDLAIRRCRELLKAQTDFNEQITEAMGLKGVIEWKIQYPDRVKELIEVFNLKEKDLEGSTPSVRISMKNGSVIAGLSGVSLVKGLSPPPYQPIPEKCESYPQCFGSCGTYMNSCDIRKKLEKKKEK